MPTILIHNIVFICFFTALYLLKIFASYINSINSSELLLGLLQWITAQNYAYVNLASIGFMYCQLLMLPSDIKVFITDQETLYGAYVMLA